MLVGVDKRQKGHCIEHTEGERAIHTGIVRDTGNTATETYRDRETYNNIPTHC